MKGTTNGQQVELLITPKQLAVKCELGLIKWDWPSANTNSWERSTPKIGLT